jgi:NaMN:DMB phosphoribosyltransferase
MGRASARAGSTVADVSPVLVGTEDEVVDVLVVAEVVQAETTSATAIPSAIGRPHLIC